MSSEHGQKLSQALMDIKRRVLPSQEDKAWNQYLKLTEGNREKLFGLIKSGELKPEYTKRTIQNLLEPKCLVFSPFTLNWRTIHPDQAVLGSGILLDNISQVEKSTDEISQEALERYGLVVQQFLPLVPENLAERLFAKVDISTGGYRHLDYLYMDSKIAEQWKSKAAAKMHKVIDQELSSNQSQVWLEPESAACRYRDILGRMSLGPLFVSRQFYQDELVFMLDAKKQGSILDTFYTETAMGLIDNPDLRHRFIRRQILPVGENDLGGFEIYNAKDIAASIAILQAFSEDNDLKFYFRAALTRWRERSAEERQ